jgi:hypothetical protein
MINAKQRGQRMIDANFCGIGAMAAEGSSILVRAMAASRAKILARSVEL